MMRHTVMASIAAFLPISAVHADCLDDAANYQHISVQLVRVIAEQESQMRPGAVHINADGSEDIGLMQVNSAEMPALARFGIGRQQLFDPCVNAYVGTWILASKIRRFGPTWKAVGAYNARSSAKQLVYANAIYSRLQRKAH